MSDLLTNPPGWNIDVPAGTYLIRADVVMNRRPGPGGYAAIFEAKDLSETKIIRGGIPDTTTDDAIQTLIAKMADVIGANRAVIFTRNAPIHEAMATKFKPFKMIRMLGYHNHVVADATRHAAVMAERASCKRKDEFETFAIARYHRSEEYSPGQDVMTMHKAVQVIADKADLDGVSSPAVQQAMQDLLDAAEKERVSRLNEVVRSITANDIPRRIKGN